MVEHPSDRGRAIDAQSSEALRVMDAHCRAEEQQEDVTEI